MTLTVREAARLLRVSEKTVYRWIADGRLPARRIGDQLRLSRAELLDWVAANRAEASIQLYTEPDEEEASLPSLADALTSGGIVYRIDGRSRDEVLRAAVLATRLPEGVSADFMFEVLRAREQLASTAVGEGIAIPHPRHPLVLHVPEPSITLCFLEEPVDFGAVDGQPVFALFLLLSPSVRAHLHLLGRLAFALRQPGFHRAIRRQAGRNVILKEAAQVDELCRPAPGGERAQRPQRR
jgi:PTS system nitrogen regulatory IIA component